MFIIDTIQLRQNVKKKKVQERLYYGILKLTFVFDQILLHHFYLFMMFFYFFPNH